MEPFSRAIAYTLRVAVNPALIRQQFHSLTHLGSNERRSPDSPFHHRGGHHVFPFLIEERYIIDLALRRFSKSLLIRLRLVCAEDGSNRWARPLVYYP